jgi:hypothetical protein
MQAAESTLCDLMEFSAENPPSSGCKTYASSNLQQIEKWN